MYSYFTSEGNTTTYQYANEQLSLFLALPKQTWIMESKGDSRQQRHVPGSIGKLEDDLVLQIIDLAQPAVIGYVVTIHERL